jgi:uncharacterized iron-regulated protein
MTRAIVESDITNRAAFSSSRRELIEIQKAIVEELKREIHTSVGRETKEYHQYLQDYNREFKHFRRCSRMQELLESLRHADIVYNGDYHSMPQAQRIPLRILRRLVHLRPRITLAVEMVRIEHQHHLDRYMTGQIPEGEFLTAIDYDRTWGFPWEQYCDLFHFARKCGLRVIGINSQPREGRWTLKKRDQAAARVIAKELLERPERLVYVFDGDLHIAPPHLPAAVEGLLSDFALKPKKVIIYQNNETIYWELARHNLEQETDVVLISDDRFCVMSTPPIIKFQSYLNWIDKTRELASPSLRGWQGDVFGDEALYNQMLYLVQIISQFLEIEAAGLDDFVVHSPADLDLLYRLRADRRLSAREVEAIATHIRANESCFIENGNIIYIANLSINHAAEEAAHFINRVCAGPRRPNLTPAEDFYFRVLSEALGFFGSKIINHKRPCYSMDDFKYLKKRHPARSPDRIRELKTIGRYLAHHKRRERDFLSSGKPWKLRGPIYGLPLPIHLGVTHTLGYMLGERLFRNMLRGYISKAAIRGLFFVDFSELSRSFTTYLDLISPLSIAGGRAGSVPSRHRQTSSPSRTTSGRAPSIK